jgi:hypothetical protein
METPVISPLSPQFKRKTRTIAKKNDLDKWTVLLKAEMLDEFEDVKRNVESDVIMQLRDLTKELDATDWMFE